ncbi:MAG: hypothetical protein WBI07_02780, partial [Mobilitalea sp.]
SLMSFFFLLIFVSTWLDLGPLMFIMPIIWFYAFFDAHNLRAMPDDEFYAQEDDYISIPGLTKEKSQLLQGKYRIVLAAALIIVGISVLWNNMYSIINQIMPSYFSNALYYIGRYVPQMAIGCAIIALGFYLIRGKKKDLDNLDPTQITENKGGNL